MSKVPVYIPEEGDDEIVELSLELPRVVKRKVEALFLSLEYDSWEAWLSSVSDEVLAHIDNEVMISLATASKLVPEWTRNISENIPLVKAGKGLLELKGMYGGKRIVCIGGGPSIYRKDHLEVIARTEDLVTVVCDKLLRKCVAAGIRPDVVAALDSSELTYAFYDGIDLKGLKVAVSAASHPPLVRKLVDGGADVYFYIPFMPEQFLPNITNIYFMLCGGKAPIIDPIGSVGGLCWALGVILGARKIGLVGLDEAYYKDTRIDETIYFQTLFDQYGGDMAKVEQCYTRFTHKCYGDDYVTDVVLLGYARALVKAIDRSDVPTYNATEGGILCGGKLRCTTLERFLSV